MDTERLTKDLVSTLQKLSSMIPDDRATFLNKMAVFRPYPQTVAQKIYAAIYRAEQEQEEQAYKKHQAYTFDPFHAGIDRFLKIPQLAEELRTVLENQRRQRQQEIKQKAVKNNAFVYHISNISPQEITDHVLRPRAQLEHFRDQGFVNAVFASSSNNWAMALKIGGSVSTSVSSSRSSDKQRVIVSDKDKFLAFKLKHPYSYQYKFPVALFEPNVGYNGAFTGEWYALDKSLSIDEKNCTKKSVDEIVSTDADLYFVAKDHSYRTVRSNLNKKESITDLVKQGKLIPYEMNTLLRLSSDTCLHDTFLPFSKGNTR